MKNRIKSLIASIPKTFSGLNSRLLFVLMLLFWLPANSYGQQLQQPTSGQENFLFYTVIAMVFFVMLLVLIVAIYTLLILKRIIKNERGEAEEVEEAESGWDILTAKLTDAVPVEEEETVLLSHDYDGIHELDNHLPPWWKGLFYITIAFSIVYIAVYHVFETAPLQIQEYQNELLAAAEQDKERKTNDEDLINEDNVTFTDEVAVIEQGKSLYEVNCVACHRKDGGGLPGLGPNLTDEFWIHGGGVKNIYKTIQNGVPGTSMISWKTQMSPEDMRAIACYAITLFGTNPPNAREPQGEKYIPEEDTPSTE